MTRSSQWLRPRFAAPWWRQLLRQGAASAILCGVFLVASARPAHAGINVWTRSNGGPHGFTYTLAIDPQTSTTLYAGAADGVYRSTGGGDTWTVTGLVPTYLSGVFALAIDPQTPTTLYAGIGSTYHDGPVRAELVTEGSEGVYKTTDGGNTWSTTGLSSPAGALAIDPQTPTTLYAGAGRFGSVEGVYRTTDGGNTWSTTGLSSPVGALAIDPQTPTTLYAGADRTGSVEGSQGVYKTTDGGDTWITLSLPAGEWSRIIGLAIDPQTPTTLYAGTERCFGCGMGGFCCVPGEAYKSTDGGDIWSRLPIAATVLTIDPQTPTTLYAVADRVFKSTDGGGTWSDFSSGLPRGSYDDEGVLALAIDPIEPRRVYAATRTGVFAIEQVVVGTGTPESCTEAALNAALAGLVTFDCGPGPVTITITSTKTIAYDTVIDGGGRITISGGNRVGVFAVNGVSLTVQNLTIADAGGSSAGSGGGIFNGSGNLTVIDSTFSRNSAGVYGGGIYSNGGTVTVTNSTFSNNSAGYGGGGIFSDSGTVTVTNSTFSGNSARDGRGGGIDSNGGTVTITDSAFSGNSANHGGGIDSNGGRVTVTACSFSGNSAHDGGGIDSDSELAVTNCTFSGNSAGFGGGGIDSNGGTVTVTNSTFSSNSAGVGGGIYSDASTATVTNSTFSDNSAAPYNAGGGIFNVSGMLTVTNSTFSGNSAGFGGGIDNGGTLTVANSTFSGNSGHDRGGGINNRGTASSLTVADSTFFANIGNYGGGGLDSSGGRVTINASSFSGNSAVYNGGGIGTNNSTALTVANSTFSGNSAATGGGIGNVGGTENGSTLTVTNSTFAGNSAVGEGAAGGIYDGGTLLVVTNTIIATSTSGGNCAGSITDGGHNIDDGTTCGFTPALGSLSNTSPQFDPAGLRFNGGPTQTVALCSSTGMPAGCTGASPAIDAGDQAICAAAPVNDHDQRGFARPGTGHRQCSIGAYEADATLPACVGDCDGGGVVTVDEIITLVNVALGNAPSSACPHGVPSGAEVDVALIIQAVNVALNGCVPDSACDDHNPCTVDRFVSGACQHTPPVLPCTNGPAAAPMYAGVWTDDTAERHIFRDQDVDALLAAWESQSAAGFRLIGVAGHESSPGLVTFDSLFKASDDPAYGLYVTTDRAAFDAQVGSLDAQGIKLIHFETFIGAGRQWYVGVWLGAGSSALVIDVSFDELIAEVSTRSAAGMRLVDIETYEVGGSRLYAGVFNAGSEPYDLRVGVSWDPFSAAFEDNRALHLVDVETWEEGGRRLYAGVWNGANAGSERLVGGHDWAAFSAENMAFEQKGKKLVDLDRFPGLPVPPAIFSAKIYGHLGTQAVGYSYALAKDGTVIGYGAQGYKQAPWDSSGSGLPMTPDTRMQLASVSKAITATAFVTLGVSADDNFYPYVQQRFPTHGQGIDQVKIADLLTHKSGISQRFNGSCGALYGFTFDEFVDLLLSQPVVGTPGVDYEYNNNNSCVLRAVIEAVAGQDYISYVNSHVFVPFGVFDTTAYADPIDPALYYGVSDGTVVQSDGFLWTQDFTSFAGGCCWYGSAIDMIGFLNGLRTFAVLTPQRTDEMFNRGFGSFPVDTAAGTAFWHGGLGTSGYRGVHTMVGHLPEGYDATVLINTVDLAYVNVVDTGPLRIFPLPSIDAVVDAFNSYWNEIQ